MTEGVTFRPFLPGDQARVYALVIAGLAEHFDEPKPWMNPDLDDIATTYAGETFLLAVVEGTIIGCGALITEDESTGRIVRVSVAPAHRRQGLGRAISTQLLTSARARGFSAVVIETNSAWAGALRLYQSLGFAEYDRTVDPDHGYTEVHMRLAL